MSKIWKGAKIVCPEVNGVATLSRDLSEFILSPSYGICSMYVIISMCFHVTLAHRVGEYKDISKIVNEIIPRLISMVS